MNVIAASPGWRNLAVWAMPPVAYALASDTLIGVVRSWVIARHKHQNAALAAARRLAIWLASRQQTPDFTRGLLRFAQTGAITQNMKTQLRVHARSGTYSDQPQAARLMEYCVARGADLGPIGLDFGRACDEIDRADVMLADLRDRVREGQGPQEPTWPDTDGSRIIALARPDPKGRTVSFILDATTANITMFAVAAYAGEREAHVREVEHFAEKWPEDSYGKRNRQAIAARETRVAARLRAVERAYRTAIERDAAVKPEPAQTIHPADREMELE
jgi:hypothetical protein